MLALALSVSALLGSSPVTLETFDEPPPLCWIDPREGHTMAAADKKPNSFKTAGGLYFGKQQSWPQSAGALFEHASALHDQIISDAQAKGVTLGIGTAILIDQTVSDSWLVTVAVPVLDGKGLQESDAPDQVGPKLFRMVPGTVAHVRYEGVPQTSPGEAFNLLIKYLGAPESGVTIGPNAVLEFYNWADVGSTKTTTLEACVQFQGTK